MVQCWQTLLLPERDCALRTPQADRLARELEQLETELTLSGANTEEITLEKANYFAERDLWSDALQQIYSVENSSTALNSNTQEIVNYLCESSNADFNYSREQ